MAENMQVFIVEEVKYLLRNYLVAVLLGLKWLAGVLLGLE